MQSINDRINFSNWFVTLYADRSVADKLITHLWKMFYFPSLERWNYFRSWNSSSNLSYDRDNTKSSKFSGVDFQKTNKIMEADFEVKSQQNLHVKHLIVNGDEVAYWLSKGNEWHVRVREFMAGYLHSWTFIYKVWCARAVGISQSIAFPTVSAL